MYGLGTRSYNNSTEARENKRQQRETTQRFLEQPRPEIVLDGSWLMCRCDGLPHAHQAHDLREILNYRPWFRWGYLVERAKGNHGV